ncbi:hypothetical protein CLTEP_17950 [Clostridium tepidiprofundi DSM 19306]|uniref:Lipoprotein n=1 Tax=Clostridium tepidiprofundi DSM 19306 TaxID=1121338 RepID=A0A151B326_9CLOT|nr:hypothetical protein [Clostridium tepidiprofundi]KYH34296.1 hypothetical protein CLTEP_17950 [Clostridium tepidiprofundi DSM 19306]
MKTSKKIMVAGLIGAMTLTTVACSTGTGKKAENVKNPTSVEASKTVKPKVKTDKSDETKVNAENSKYAVEKVFEKPELLKEFTNKDVDYATYLKSEPFKAIFLDKDNKLLQEIDVYTLPNAKDSTALYLYLKEDKVVNAKLDEFNGDIDTQAYDYDTLVCSTDVEKQAKEADFPYDLAKKKDEAEKELKSKFEGKSLDELNKILKVYVPYQRYSRKDTDKTLDVYMIVSEEGYTASSTVNVIVKDNKIEKLYVDDSYRPSKSPIDVLKAAK